MKDDHKPPKHGPWFTPEQASKFADHIEEVEKLLDKYGTLSQGGETLAHGLLYTGPTVSHDIDWDDFSATNVNASTTTPYMTVEDCHDFFKSQGMPIMGVDFGDELMMKPTYKGTWAHALKSWNDISKAYMDDMADKIKQQMAEGFYNDAYSMMGETPSYTDMQCKIASNKPARHTTMKQESAEIHNRLPREFRTKRTAELLWLQGECFDRGIGAMAVKHNIAKVTL